MAWIEGAAFGTLASVIAIIAISAIGLMLLSGRIDLRRGALTVLGCFILFGAAKIASGLLALATPSGNSAPRVAAVETDFVPAQLPAPAMRDPYSSASIHVQ